MNLLEEAMEIHYDVLMIGEDYLIKRDGLSAEQKMVFNNTVEEEVELFENLWQSSSYDLEEEYEELLEVKELVSNEVL